MSHSDACATSHRCSDCNGVLADDQRYCLRCGARRGPLPASAQQFLGLGAASAELGAGAAAAAREREPLWLPGPRAAAVAVMGLLAFGVVVGSLASPTRSSEASAPLIVAVTPAAAPAPAPPPATPPAPIETTTADTAPPAPTAPAQPAAPAAPAPTPAPSAPPAPPKPTSVKHVFVIVLSGHGFDDAFGPKAKDAYLSRTLARQGELLPNYYGVAQGELANEIALVSGQGPTNQTTANCPQYGDVTPGTADASGQAQGDGCVYPAATQTLADQLTKAKKSWKAYVEDIGNGPQGEPTTCRHPALGTPDAEQSPRPGDAYVTWRNPFVYFHSLIDGTACAGGDVGLDQLGFDLTSESTTPTVSYIVPNRCHDGSDTPCAPGQPAGLAAAGDFLRTLIPQIEGSAAYRAGGLIAITFDQAPQTGPSADSTSCCDQPAYPNLTSTTATPPAGTTTTPAPTTTTPAPATTTPTSTTTTPTSTTTTPTSTTPAPTTTTTTPAATPPPPGGGRVGLLLISPLVKPDTTYSVGSFNHYSLLAGIEDLFNLPRLGYAADDQLPVVDQTVYQAGVARSSSRSASSAAKHRSHAKRRASSAAAGRS
jgi:hypothetical protein